MNFLLIPIRFPAFLALVVIVVVPPFFVAAQPPVTETETEASADPMIEPDARPKRSTASEGSADAPTPPRLADSPPTDPSEASPGSATEALMADVKYLASEALRGRGVADESIHLAADFIEDRMRSAGLSLDDVPGGPRQSVPIRLDSQAGSADANFAEFRFDGSSESLRAALGVSMMPLAIGNETGSATGPLVWVGYGVSDLALNYDEYANLDVDGAVVLMLRKEPRGADPDGAFGGRRPTRNATFNAKIKAAAERGAAAVILVNDSVSTEKQILDVRERERRESERREAFIKQLDELPAEATKLRDSIQSKIARIDGILASFDAEVAKAEAGLLGVEEAGVRRQGQPDLPVFSVSRAIADSLLVRAGGQSLESLETLMNITLRPTSRPIAGVTATVSVAVTPTRRRSDNVIGMIGGRGSLADQTVVVGAHYDHVGMGGYGSLAPGTVAIHNGADDNASGTAAMLAVARQLSDRLEGSTDHRRVVFIAFTGEERGLLGSAAYVGQPRFALENTVAMVNLDMVGRLRDNELTVYGTGSGDSLDAIVEGCNETAGFKLFKIASGFGPSDHQSFYEQRIPVLFFFTGLHNDYHRPTDDFDKIDFGGLTRITDMVSDATMRLATAAEPPRYVLTGTDNPIRRQLTVAMGVRLRATGEGVVISEVEPGSAAEAAGLRVGDQIERMGRKPIREVSQVFQQLRGRKPGDRMALEFVRGNNTIRTTLQLKARP